MSGVPAPRRVDKYLGGMDQVPVLWFTAGLSCDGDSIAMTAATQPSLEDLVLGAFPGVHQLAQVARAVTANRMR